MNFLVVSTWKISYPRIYLTILFCCVCFLSLNVGSSGWDLSQAFSEILGGKSFSEIGNGILAFRLQRLLACLLCGGFLALAGSCLQVMLRNPMADPFVLGISSGGAFGVLLGILLGFQSFSIFSRLFSFLGCLLALMLMLAFNLLIGRNQFLTQWTQKRRLGMFRKSSLGDLVLIGFVLNAFFGAISMIFFAIASPFQMAIAQRWLMGTVQVSSFEEIVFLCFCGFFPAFVLLRQRSKLFLLSFGDSYARSLGLDVEKLTRIVLISVAILVGAVVSSVGSVGFVGLVSPHISKIFLGKRVESANDWVFSMFLGAMLLSIADLLSRFVISTGDFPLGVFTSLLGAPMLAYLLIRRKSGDD